MTPTNHQVRLGGRPTGLPKRADWELTQEPTPTPGPGQLVTAVTHISLDPAMRGWMNAGASYIDPVEIGDVMRAAGVGRVLASEHPDFTEGDHVYGTFGVQEYAISDGSGVIRIDPSLAPPPTYLGTLGLSGMTAYFGLLDVGELKDGRHCRGVGGGRRRRQCRGPDRQAEGRAGDRHRRRRGEVPLARRRARLRRGDRLQGAGRAPRAAGRAPRRGWTCTSTTSAARSSTPC